MTQRDPARDNPRVLVVEDEDNIQLVYRTALSAAGFEVETVGDGVEALWRVISAPPDVIVMDLGLPNVRGEAVLQELATDHRTKDIPIVVATGDLVTPALPAQTVLHKPVSLKELVAAVERAVARTRHHSSP
jgi:CheY-like chemotaxis protein